MLVDHLRWLDDDEEADVAKRVRTVLFWFVVAFFVYAIFQSPDQAAALVRNALEGIMAFLRAIGEFFDALLEEA